MNAGKSSSRDWRAQPPVPSTYSREWRGDSRDSSSRFSRKARLRLMALALVILLGLIVVLLAPVGDRVRPTQIVAFGIGAYGGRANPQGAMPINPFGEQDAGAFHVLNDRNPDQFPTVRQEANALSGAQLLTFLQTEAQSPGLAGRNLLVFCTLHGLVQPSGEVALFAIDALPDSSNSNAPPMVPLADLMARLEDSAARRILLVLDAARLDANWRLGILANDVAAQAAVRWPAQSPVPGPNASRDASKVAILLAASPGQQSWPAENQSAFARYLVEGLSGAADGWIDAPTPGDKGPHDSRVSLHELTAYTRQQISGWTRQHFGARQSVQLLGNTADFDLAAVSTAATAKPKNADETKTAAAAATMTAADPAAATPPAKAVAAAPTAEQIQAQLAAHWKARDRMRGADGGASAVARQVPLAWRSWESQLQLAETLRRGGLQELTPPALKRADEILKKIQEQTDSLSNLELDAGNSQRLTLAELGFEPNAAPPTRDELATVTKYLQSLTPEAGAAAGSLPVKDAAVPVPEWRVIQFWLKQEMLRDRTQDNWSRLRPIVEQLQRAGRYPLSPETILIRDVLTAENAAARFGTGDALERILNLRGRYRQLAMQTPESLPLIRGTVEDGLRELNAAERWLFATGSDRPEIRSWLEKSERAASDAEDATNRYASTLGIWNDLLLELPAYAAWVSTRANDNDRGPVDWTRMRELARRWAERGRSGAWEEEPLSTSWPDRPTRWTDLERLLLTQLVDALRLKRALLPGSSDAGAQPVSAEALAELSKQAQRHRREFRDEVRRALPRLGTATSPPPSVWQEANRLLEQPWLSSDERRELEGLISKSPAGDVLADRSPDTGALWQGFWAIAVLDLLVKNADQTAPLWQDWDRLVELSIRPGDAASALSPAEQQILRERRAKLGQSIRQQWSNLQGDSMAVRDGRSVPDWIMVAATLEPSSVPAVDPDLQLQRERQRQFANWLVVFATDWRNHGREIAGSDVIGGDSPAVRVELLARDLGATVPAAEPAATLRFQETVPPAFNAERRGRLELSLSAPLAGAASPSVILSTRSARLVDSPAQSLALQPAVRPVPASGQLQLELQLGEDVETQQLLLAVLTEADGFPLDFEEIALQPPFDPRSWRIEFTEAKSGTPLETQPLSSPVGAKVYLPPSASVSVGAHLIRPDKDTTPSAKITIHQVTEAGRVALVEQLELPLQPGQKQTPIVLDLPPVPMEPAAAAAAAPAAGPLADLARGWVFEITPAGQSPLEYLIRPTFWSAAKFLREPQPMIRDDEFVLELERLPASAEDVLLPKKIPVDLRLPAGLENDVTGRNLAGSLEAGQRPTLSFTLPADWRDRAREEPLAVALDVAGLPHAYRWQIAPSGSVTPITGQPARLEARLVFPPPADAKAPPRLGPVLRQGQEPLNLTFAVDATALDRTEETGDWLLSYEVVRETDEGTQRTPLQDSWRLYSSIERHVFLDGIKAGAWNLTTAARDYDRQETASDIRGLSGRFEVRAQLLRGDQQPAATARLRFAIDDDAPPAVEIKGINNRPKGIDRDLPFRIEAADPESGINRIAYGFDQNGDQQLQQDEELGSRMYVGLDNPAVNWPVVIPKSGLAPMEKDEELRRLIATVRNTLGTTAQQDFPVTFRKPVVNVPVKATKGDLVVSFKTSRGANSTVEIEGPEARSEETRENSVTFKELKPGQYKVTVKVNYAVLGRKDSGEKKADVTAGESTSVSVDLSATK